MRTTALTQVLFEKAAVAWLETRKPYISPRTQKDYADYIKTLSRFFGEQHLQRITPDMIRAYQRARMSTCGASAINKEVSVLQQMLKRIGRWQDIAHDYQPLPIKHQSPGRALSDAEYERLFRLAASKPQWEVAYLFALISINTTCGPKEVFTLRRQDVNIKECFLRIQPEGAKNRHRVRLIPLNEIAKGALQRAMTIALARGSNQESHYIFPFRTRGNAFGGVFDPNRHCTTVKTAWHQLTVAAGLGGLRPYDMRHTAITNLLQNPENSEETVKSVAGHISPHILKTYSHIRMDAKRSALDALVRKSFRA